MANLKEVPCIVGITGTIGAGKGEAVKYLVEHCGYNHYSVRDFLVREIKRRGIEPVDRTAMFLVSNDLRKTYGGDYIVRSLFEEAHAAGGDSVIESIRARSEVAYLEALPHAFLLGVDAPAEVRYERILKRNSETDHVTFEQFLAEEERESVSENPDEQNLRWCLRAADRVVDNTGSLEEFRANIDRAVSWHRDRADQALRA